MEFKRILQWFLPVLMSLFLVAGCGDLEPDMQDTRTVILNMDFHGKSSSRSSSSDSASELSQYNTHLILALPSWEYLTSNYNNFHNSFAQGLMNTSDKKVSLEIPLNTQMKIFAFLFQENYNSLPEFLSGTRTVGYYGESQSFSIGTNTNSLSLGIALIQVPGTGTEDFGGDTEDFGGDTGDFGGDTGDFGGDTGDFGGDTEDFGDGDFGGDTGDFGGDTEDFGDGDFGGDTGTGTDTGTDTTVPTASVTAVTITSSDNATVRSTETGTAYLVNTAITVSNLASITGAYDNQTNEVDISLANTDTPLPATGLETGTYKVYAVDAENNLSSASLDNVTIAGLVDIDGNAYRTVVIGTQTWMAENLKVTKYRNGDNITHITTNSDWANDTSGAYGYYDDNTTLRDTYGMLYNWYAVDNSSSRYICPEGWHVPTASSNSWCNAEFNCLRTYLGGVVAGGKMKETGTAHWESENAGTSNSSGFTARGSGYRWYSSGTYGGLKEKSYFWTAFAPNSSNAHFREMWYNSNDLGSGQTIQSMGYSVRCLKD
jgi:uncharacterized protein (TIGR02145 family)